MSGIKNVYVPAMGRLRYRNFERFRKRTLYMFMDKKQHKMWQLKNCHINSIFMLPQLLTKSLHSLYSPLCFIPQPIL